MYTPSGRLARFGTRLLEDHKEAQGCGDWTRSFTILAGLFRCKTSETLGDHGYRSNHHEAARKPGSRGSKGKRSEKSGCVGQVSLSPDARKSPLAPKGLRRRMNGIFMSVARHTGASDP